MRRNLNAPAFRAAGIICVIAAGLLLDQKLPFGGQIITNIAVWLIFIGILRHVSRQEQVSLVACVFYATMFLLALAMEIYGTWLGNWTWSPHVLWLGLTTLNPPLAAGAFYCLLDLLVTATNVGDEGGRSFVPGVGGEGSSDVTKLRNAR